MLTESKLVECTKCMHQFSVLADYVQYYEFSPPSLCPNPDGCSGFQFKDKEQFTGDNCRDYQVRNLYTTLNEMLGYIILRVTLFPGGGGGIFVVDMWGETMKNFHPFCFFNAHKFNFMLKP